MAAPDWHYAPKLPSVSVSPSAEIVEGSSVTLTCSSDANPAANYTWYKEDEDPDPPPLSGEPQLVFSSIQSSDSGQYYCRAENLLGTNRSEFISIDVKYGPKLPSVSVSPSAEIVEGSSVTLTCSSDANPAANYTWYKEDEDSPKASGQIFIITDFRAEHSGSYYCEAQNMRGRSNSTLHLTVVSVLDKTAMIIRNTRLTLAVVIPISLLLFCLWKRKKKALSSTTEPHEPIETVELDSDPEYGNISNAAAQTEDSEEQEDRYINTGSSLFVIFGSSDSYSCAVSGYEDQRSPSVYAPKLPSVSVSPSAEIVEGSSVTLTCSSDANPAANYIKWYKVGIQHHLSDNSKLVFSSIQSSDSGRYYCRAENQLGWRMSEYINVHVKYAPKLPSVSVSPSAEIVEGSSVTLTCSSDANPAANYTWYKEDEDSPKASGQIFIITDFRAEHSGNYYCEAQNMRGRSNSSSYLVAASGKSYMKGIHLDIILTIQLSKRLF
ncbi:B-cell receptor CD22-like [Anarhichas minor]|uniref:B-cell receptor CD22-like n=1 Tax=Anarhichas minor TaxID=65739 RepID=UPI003F7404B6